MCSRLLLQFVITVSLLSTSLAATYQAVVPDTTFTKETGNNTSAATSFPGCEVTSVTKGECVNNGNAIARNVSKVDIHTLLGPDQQGAKIFTTYIPYWGSRSHPDIGYSSTDPTQVAREVGDLTSRGFDGVLIDWYGPGSWEEQGAEQLKNALEQQSHLNFMLMIDQGAIKWHSCFPNCTATKALLDAITFARLQGYFNSVAAARTTDGKVLVAQFGLEPYPVDWSAVRTANQDLEWIFENASAFNNAVTAGAYGWISPKNPAQEGYEGLDYTQYFLKIAAQHPGKLNYASVWKGFDDVVASWAPPGGRHIEQLCGKTWLDSWATLRNWSGRLDAVQVVTWHDYEEGTEIQSGIDDCQSIRAALQGNKLNWSVPNEATIDHYTLFISIDGQQLMTLGDFPVGVRTLDLKAYNFAAGRYKVFVKAVGKPSITNHISNAVLYTILPTTHN